MIQLQLTLPLLLLLLSSARHTGGVPSRSGWVTMWPHPFPDNSNRCPYVTNWAGNVMFHAQAEICVPRNLMELREIVKNSEGVVKVVGAGHSFSLIGDGDVLVSLEKMDSILLDAEAQEVTIEGGVTYSQLVLFLDKHGYALETLPSLPHVTVVGAVATASHGSGETFGNLATHVTALDYVISNGSVVSYTQTGNPSDFYGAVVSLGGLGVVSKMTLRIVPSYFLRQCVYQNLTWESFMNHFQEINKDSYSVSYFLEWKTLSIRLLWKRDKTTHHSIDCSEIYFGGKLRREPVLLQESVQKIKTSHVDKWYKVLPFFQIEDNLPSAELQTEYFVDRSLSIPVIKEISQVLQSFTEQELEILLPNGGSEIRFVKSDTLWLSPCNHRDCLAVHFTMAPGPDVIYLFHKIWAVFEKFDGRPHWGKLWWTSGKKVRELYGENINNFQKLYENHDPEGKFMNHFLEDILK